MNAKELIKKAKIKLQFENPFFAYALLFHKIKENSKIETMCVKYDRIKKEYYLEYNPTFVESLKFNELLGALCHEVLHCILLHLHQGFKIVQKVSFDIKNGKTKLSLKTIKTLINISQDLVINSILIKNGFTLPKGVIIPQFDEYTLIFGDREIVIEDISKKNFEEIFYEIYEKVKDLNIEYSYDYQDLEDYEEATDEKEISEKENEILTEASQISKVIGKEPLGIERLVDFAYGNKINWKKLLKKYINGYFPSSLTWQKPNKKYEKVILPSIDKKLGKALVIVDTSGSISDKELNEFLSEIYSLLRNRARIRLLTHDYEVQNDVEIRNVEELKKVEIKGGGGTSFNNVAKYIHEKKIKYKAIFWLTDGYGDKINKKYKLDNLVWILCKDGSDEIVKKYGKVLWL